MTVAVGSEQRIGVLTRLPDKPPDGSLQREFQSLGRRQYIDVTHAGDANAWMRLFGHAVQEAEDSRPRASTLPPSSLQLAVHRDHSTCPIGRTFHSIRNTGVEDLLKCFENGSWDALSKESNSTTLMTMMQGLN